MTIDQLRALMEEAARDLVARAERPYPVSVVLPLEQSTKVIALDGFPDEDGARKDALSVIAARQMVPNNASCFGFLAEADGPGGQELLVVVYGARQRGGFVTGALLQDGGVGTFAEPEPLEPAAMPFVQPLQHAADTSSPPSGATSGLPIISG